MAQQQLQLTPSLEDYLETIYEVTRQRSVARVRDIAKARSVRASSVTPAMKRLANMNLVSYVQREYIELTPEGEKEARRILTRHRVLTRFFTDVLKMDAKAAEEDACTIEHVISTDAIDRLVRLFEFVQSCPEGRHDFLARFHSCPLFDTDAPDCGKQCQSRVEPLGAESLANTVFDMKPGSKAQVIRVDAKGAVRQRLLDLGMLPGASIEFERSAPGGDPVWVKLLGSQIALRKREAESIRVSDA